MARHADEDADVPKDKLLRELGYGGPRDLAESLMQAAGLSNPRKERIRADKRDAVREALAQGVLLACGRGDCLAEAEAWKVGGDPRPIHHASRAEACEVCGGSTNARWVDEMVEACRRAGWRRLCVVGGSPSSCRDLVELVGGRVETKIVVGTTARSRSQASADIAWADKVVLWGATQLDHKVSGLYAGAKVLQTAQRGVAALTREIARSAEGLGRKG